MIASDLYDWGQDGIITGINFTDDNVIPCVNGKIYSCDWIITNPPFNQAENFLIKACLRARVGVAFLVRTAFLESEGRYYLFENLTPRLVAQFSERVPMHKGRWLPKGSTATSYAWIVWLKSGDKWNLSNITNSDPRSSMRMMLIPYGCRTKLSRDSDKILAARVAPQFVPDDILTTDNFDG